MKSTLFAAAAMIVLGSSTAAQAGPGYFTELGRNVGYGISDGYHAQRYCMSKSAGCSATQHGMMPQPMMPMQMVPQPMMSPHVMPQAYSPYGPGQLQQVGYPGMPVAAPMYQPRSQAYGPAYTAPPFVTPEYRPTLPWSR